MRSGSRRDWGPLVKWLWKVIEGDNILSEDSGMRQPHEEGTQGPRWYLEWRRTGRGVRGSVMLDGKGAKGVRPQAEPSVL